MLKKILKTVLIAVCSSIAIVIGILLLAGIIDFVVTDHSANVGFEGVDWNGRWYSNVSGKYTEGKTIATSKDFNWDIKEVKEDPSHTFITARSFLANHLYVAEDYDIPKSGEITKVYWSGDYITDEDFIKAMTEIDAAKTATFDYETEGIFMLTDNQRMKDLYFAYEDCPIATEFKGYMGKINGSWVITTYISSDQRNEDGSPKPYIVTCYSIPEQYASILEKYFFE